MSGHSKWSQIKRQKGAADVKRGVTFSKIANTIIMAAKKGSDPNANFELKMAIEKARSVNMPKENIDRAIKRGSGESGAANLEEVRYEIIGPGGIGILVEALTDNKNRTNSGLKNIISTYSAKLASTGAVAYQFERMGEILLEIKDHKSEELELAAIDAGARDFEEQGDVLAIYTNPLELEIIKKRLEEQNLNIRETSLTWEPKNTLKIEDKILANKILQFIENLEAQEEVAAVFSNFDISEELIQ